jgi:signal transduction histidine kinase
MSVIAAVRGAEDALLSVQASVVERDHELRAGLFALEVTSGVLRRDRDRLSSGDVDMLMDGLGSEIARLRALLEASPVSAASYDLGAAIAGAVACARACGLVVDAAVPAGVAVLGRPDTAAQVVVGLLDNVRRHAAGSPVELDVTVQDATVVLRVGDRGPGVDAGLRDRLFDRGAHHPDSDGSGLGLYIGRRLIVEDGGELTVEARPGGGSTFVVRFQAASRR